MSPPPEEKGSVVKLALKRADVAQMVLADPLLKSAPLLKAFGPKREAVLALGIARRYPNRAVLFQQGDAGDALFFVLKGEVRLSARKGTDQVDLGSAARGEVFGEAELLLGGKVRGLTALAFGDVDAVEFPREALLEGGKVMLALHAYLTPIARARIAALDAMDDFLNRW